MSPLMSQLSKYVRADKISIERLHKECKILGIEQRMRRQ